MIQLRFKNRARFELLDVVLNILQHLLIALAFILFLSFLQVSVAEITMSVSSQLEPISRELSYLSPIAGLFCLITAFVVRKILIGLKHKHRLDAVENL